MFKKIIIPSFVCCLILSNILFIKAHATDYSQSIYNGTRWEAIKNDHLDSETDRLIFVKYKKGTRATVEMWKKVETTKTSTTGEASEQVDNADDEIVYNWKKILSSYAYVGKKGIDKKKEGDRKTPVGIFNITMAFGRKKSPGTAGIPYKKLNKYHYWSAEKATYNTFVDVRKLGRKKIRGEKLISFKSYAYVLAMDFNKECIYKKGSAIFLHCTHVRNKYTAGCVAVPEKVMKKIMQNTTNNTKICIYRQ